MTDEHPPPARCDICSGSPIGWSYPMEDYVVVCVAVDEDGATLEGEREMEVASTGRWLVCGICHVVIETGTLGDLVKRSCDRYGATVGYQVDGEQEVVEQTIRAYLYPFFVDRGKPVAL